MQGGQRGPMPHKCRRDSRRSHAGTRDTPRWYDAGATASSTTRGLGSSPGLLAARKVPSPYRDGRARKPIPQAAIRAPLSRKQGGGENPC